MSNRIPLGWKQVSLPEVCYFQEGPGLRSWQYRSEGFPFINIRCIREGFLDLRNVQYISNEEAIECYQHFFLDEGDYVLSSSGTLGRIAKIKASDLPLMLNTSVIRFRSINEKLLSQDFLPYYLQASEFIDQITEESQGSAQVNFGPTHLKLIQCCLPPLFEQKKIAAILSSVDDVIEKTRAQIDKLKDLKTGMMQELLTKGIGHTEFKDSPVGRIPLDWKVLPLELIIEEVVDCEHKTAPYVESSEFLVVRTSNVRDGELVYDDMRFTTSEAFSEWTKRAVPSYGDVLFTREAPAGEACMVPADVKLCMGQRMVLLRPKTDTVYPDYFSLYITSEIAKLAIYKLSVGTTVTRINIEDIKDIPCLVPSLKEQKEIQLKISSIQSMINKSTFLLKSNEKIKKALMQDLLTGKVRVNVD